MKNSYFIINTTYDWQVLIYIGPWTTFTKYMKNKYQIYIEGDGNYGGYHNIMAKRESTETISYIWMPEYNENSTTLSHELLHSAIECLNSRGVPISHENQEALCYLHDDLFAMAWEKLNR